MLNLAHDLNLNLPLQGGRRFRLRASIQLRGSQEAGRAPATIFSHGFLSLLLLRVGGGGLKPTVIGHLVGPALPLFSSHSDWLCPPSRTCFRLSRKFQRSEWKERCRDHSSWFGSRFLLLTPVSQFQRGVSTYWAVLWGLFQQNANLIPLLTHCFQTRVISKMDIL